MITVEQVAMRTDDIEGQIKAFMLMGHRQWVRDTVDAVHLWTNDRGPDMGESFKVHLAFNYEFLTGAEFELIQLIDGRTYQLLLDEGTQHRFSHLGYHTEKNQQEHADDSLLTELRLLHDMGATVMQVSQTIAHKNTDRRYRYAFVTGNLTGGVPLKIIQRLLPAKSAIASIEAGRKLFACLT